jgi:hypothetical protein
MVGILIASDTALTAPAQVPEIDTDVEAATGTVLILNVIWVVLAATVTEVGTETEAELELRVTTVPPVGAGAPRVTLPTLDDPPTTEVGFNERVSVFTDVIVRTAVALPKPA